jgi:hypothetical protein
MQPYDCARLDLVAGNWDFVRLPGGCPQPMFCSFTRGASQFLYVGLHFMSALVVIWIPFFLVVSVYLRAC